MDCSPFEPVWYCRRGDRQIGPVSLNELQKRFKNGKLRDTDRIRRKGQQGWKPLSTMPGFDIEEAGQDKPSKGSRKTRGLALLRQNIVAAIGGSICLFLPLVIIFEIVMVVTSAGPFEFGTTAFLGTFLLVVPLILSLITGIPVGIVLTVLGIRLSDPEPGVRLDSRTGTIRNPSLSDRQAARAERIACWTLRIAKTMGYLLCMAVVVGVGAFIYQLFQDSTTVGMLALGGVVAFAGILWAVRHDF
ncbi:MAG: DUF4339 domain-containing protein [Planctomycetaceae bacterium]